MKKNKKLVKENDNCPSCNSGMMGNIGNQLFCSNCGLKAIKIEESQFYEVQDLSDYLLV